MIPVLPSQAIRGWPKHDDGGRARYMPLAEAFTTRFKTDAHFAAYSVPEIPRRLMLDALREEAARDRLGFGVPMVACVFDIDCSLAHAASGGDGGMPAPDAWWLDELAKLERLRDAHPGPFFYRTRGGYRIVYTLDPPELLLSPEDERTWMDRYARGVAYLRRRFGIFADPACAEWVRLFRLPHATRDGETRPEERETLGDPNKIGAWAPELTPDDVALAATLKRAKKPSAPRERRRAARAPATTGDGVLFHALRARGELGDELEPGKWAAVCPNEGAHTKGERFDGSTILYAPGDGEELGWIHCSHAHCQGLTLRDVLRRFNEDELAAARVAAGVVREPEPEPAPASASVEPMDAPRMTELGNSIRLVRKYGERLRFCDALGGWFVWDGKRWRRDTTRMVVRFAKGIARELWEEAARCQAQEMRDALLAHARKSEKAAAIAAMVKLAESGDGVACDASAFDSDPWILNVENGILDLRTVTLGRHDPGTMCTKLAPVAFDPKARAPKWDAFIAEILPDAEVRGFVQRFAGYVLTGVIRERVLFMLIGEGRNGKSVLVKVLVRLLGDYATYAAPDVLMVSDHHRHPTELADLAGRRFAALSEVRAGRTFDEATLKRLTGNEPIKARFMGHDFFAFDMQAKLAMAANHRPHVRDDTDSIWDRLREVPFTVRIPEEREDKALFDKLCAELPGILNWCVEGCRAWRDRGLGDAAAVQQATSAYREAEDPLADFFAEAVVFEPGARLSRKELREAYERHAREAGQRFLVGPHAFAKGVRDRGAEESKMGGVRLWIGVRLREERDDRQHLRVVDGALGSRSGGVDSRPRSDVDGALRDLEKKASGALRGRGGGSVALKTLRESSDPTPVPQSALVPQEDSEEEWFGEWWEAHQ